MNCEWVAWETPPLPPGPHVPCQEAGYPLSNPNWLSRCGKQVYQHNNTQTHIAENETVFKLNIAYSGVLGFGQGHAIFFIVLLVTKLLCSDRMEMINFRNRLCWRQMFYPYFTPSAFQGHLMFCLCTKEINRSSHQMCENKQEILIQMMSSEMK